MVKILVLKVILDSNFLLVPTKFQLDIFEELSILLGRRFDPIILSPTYEELAKMAEVGGPKMRLRASIGLKLAEKCRVVPVEKGVKETNDDVIVRVADERKYPVATNDRALRRRLRDLNVAVIYVRQKSRLEIDGSFS